MITIGHAFWYKGFNANNAGFEKIIDRHTNRIPKYVMLLMFFEIPSKLLLANNFGYNACEIEPA